VPDWPVGERRRGGDPDVLDGRYVLEASELVHGLRAFVVTELLDGSGDDLQTDTPLLELGVLDSLSMMSLLQHVEKQYGIKVHEDEIVPENFETLERIADMLLSAARRSRENDEADVVEALMREQETFGIRRVRRGAGSVHSAHVLEVSGAAPTWILLPALGQLSATWSPVLRSVRGERACAAVDLAGSGLSAPGVQSPCFADHMAVCRAVLDEVAGPFVLVASSISTTLATELARAYGERARGMVVSGFGLLHDPETAWRKIRDALPDDFSGADRFLDPAGPAALKDTFRGLSLPVLFIHGMDDGIVRVDEVEAAAQQLPSARVELLPRSGHAVAVDRPDAFVWCVQRFVDTLA
jgi:2-hydroxymuconate-semialdehyde hydrolase